MAAPRVSHSTWGSAVRFGLRIGLGGVSVWFMDGCFSYDWYLRVPVGGWMNGW